MGTMSETLSTCPICGYSLISGIWVEELGVFLVDCSRCTTFTISPALAAEFRQMRESGPCVDLESLSKYLREADDDDDREIREDSWHKLAVQG